MSIMLSATFSFSCYVQSAFVDSSGHRRFDVLKDFIGSKYKHFVDSDVAFMNSNAGVDWLL